LGRIRKEKINRAPQLRITKHNRSAPRSLRLAAVLGTRAYPASCGAVWGEVRARLAGGALGNLASPGSAMLEMLGAIAIAKKRGKHGSF